MEKKKKFVTYGHSLNRKEFVPIENDPRDFRNKPKTGGVWSSPADSRWGWKDWCKSECYNTNSLSHGTEFTLSPKARILKIDSSLSYRKVLKKYSRNMILYNISVVLDFEKISKDYDAILVTDYAVMEMRWPERVGIPEPGFYSWDCETLLILNWDIISDIHHF